MNYLTIAVITLSFIGCLKTPEVELPEHIRDRENLTVYPGEAVPSMNINMTRDITFGDSDEVLIGGIEYITVDSLGRVFIGDVSKKVIHVFEPDGRIVGELGREGQGPGEIITRFEWPRDEPILFVKNGYLYSIESEEETGIQTIVRYQIDMEEI